MPDEESTVIGPLKLNRRTFLKSTAVTAAALAGAAAPSLLPATAAPPAIKTLHADLEQTGEAFGRGKRSGAELVGQGAGRVLVARPSGGADQVFVSEPLAVAFPVTDIGVHWNVQSNGGHVAVDVRSSRDGKAWTPWVTPAIEVGAGQAPHPDTFAALVGADRARWVQYRVRFTVAKGAVTLRRLTLTCLNSVDGEQIQVSASRANVAEAAVAQPPIVSRSGWGCNEAYRFTNGVETWRREYRRWTKVVVHHTATTNSYTDAAAQVRSIYYYHAITQGWGDIGYNALIGNDGRIYEGRKGVDGQVVSLDLVAGHVYLCNYGTMGISMIGNFTSTPIPSRMLDAGAQLAAWACTQRDIDPLGTGVFTRSDGSTINIWNIPGHRQIASPRFPTSCPGDVGTSQLPDFRQRVAGIGASLLVDNAIAGRFTASANWGVATYNGQRYGADYRYATPKAVSDAAWFKVAIPTTGNYEVFVWYPASTAYNSATPFAIETANGRVFVRVNQQLNGGAWFSLGTYPFNAGDYNVVGVSRWSSIATGYVIADAVKLVRR
ncbi:MAG TPA: N-acetylmuramoyl-L-alanine amidase [Herpetosiphonaceae bacterium]|nr:N-acetylmuramoyl-L-alanine amidase [Herpetosiphonaceae bacterium]